MRLAAYNFEVSKEDDIAKLDALVGAALKGLMEAGASAQAIGSFALSYRQEASQILGISPSKPEAPDLGQLVTEAVSKALGTAGGGRRFRQPAMKFYVMVGGRRTSVTISAEAATKALESHGGREQVTAAIERLANSAPAEVKNRSKWIEGRLSAVMAFAADTPSARH